jgi:hypothetical protein
MRKHLHLYVLALLAGGAAVFSCGGGNGDNDGGVGYDANGLPDGYMILPDGAIVGPDGEVITDSGGVGLDVNLDGIYGPDGGGPDTSMMGEAGCSPPGITCTGNNPVFANTCDNNGNLSLVNCTQLGKLCAPGYGCVNCIPGTGSCNGNNGTHCLPDGSGTVTDFCDPQMGLACNNGICTGVCANVGQSYIGCDYYATTMVNDQLDQTTFQFAVSISNTSQSTATVTITGPGNYNQSINVNAGAVTTQTLPWVTALSTSEVTSRSNGGAYRIRSTQPITVYQFNPRDYQKTCSSPTFCVNTTNCPYQGQTCVNNACTPCFSFSNDASLLLPANAMTGNYYVPAWPTWRTPVTFTDAQIPGTIAIIATQNSTTVKFTPPNNNPVQAGAGVAATGTSTVTMNQGDVLQIASAQNAQSRGSYGSDMSGSTVVADKPVEVFGGHDCTFVPANVGYCDHLEEVAFPQETLRTDYLVVPPDNTVAAPRHYVKIIATAANTTLTYDPNNAGGPASLTNAGDVGTFLATVPFRVTANANHPIIIGTTMLGEDNFQMANINAGDPAMSAAVAMEQYRKGYSFFAPPNYAQNWVTVTALMNTAITLDGVSVGALTAIGNSGYGYKYVSLCANNSCNGVHSASSASQFGIQVYGYGSYTSYWYPGGLDLKR